MSEELDIAMKTARDGRAQVERLGITPRGYEEKDRYIMLDEIDRLRAALAEKEKEVDTQSKKWVEHVAVLHDKLAAQAQEIKTLREEIDAVKDHAEHAEQRFFTANEERIALTASLASMKSKVEDQHNVIIELGAKLNATRLREEEALAELAELRKLLTRDCVHCGQENWTATPAPVESKPKCGVCEGHPAFPSCPHCAPVESKPCASPCRKDGCPIHDSPDGCFTVGESKPKEEA